MSQVTTDPGTPAPASASTARPRVAVVTLGCGRNEVDSDQLAGLLHRDGSEVVDDPATADVVVVNTCAFIAPAKQESVDTVLAACDLRDDGVRAVVVTGCLAERYPDELAEAIPEADAVVGFAGYPMLPALLDDILAGRPHPRVVTAGQSAVAGPADVSPAEQIEAAGQSAAAEPAAAPPAAVRPAGRGALPLLVMPTAPHEAPPEAAPAPAPRTPQDDLDRIPASGPRFPLRRYGSGPTPPWAYLKIASGCDRVCTFCAIPSFRGRFRSRPLDELVAEAAWLVERGARELVLVSENTTSWGKDLAGPDGGGRALQPRLLAELSEIEGLERLRLLYLQPAELQQPLLEAMAELPKVAPYFDLSLQHVSPRLLGAMARSGSPERFAALIGAIRELAPDAVFRSNFIMGFPGETSADVVLLEDFLVTVRLDWVGLFPFSREDGTPSATMTPQIPDDVVAERLRRITDVAEHVADAAARAFVGQRLAVTVEANAASSVDAPDGFEEGAATVGRSYREAPDTDGEISLIDAAGRPAHLEVGRTVAAVVVDAVGVDLVARVEDQPSARTPLVADA